MDARLSLKQQYRLNDHCCRTYGFGAFLDTVVINKRPTPARFAEVAEPWQWDIVRMKYEAIQQLAGFHPFQEDIVRRFLTVLPRGHDKSSLEARIANFLLCYSRTAIDGKIVAADWDQGMLVYQKMEEESKLNPWLAPHLQFQKGGKIVGPSGVIEVVPADAGGSYGFTSNLYILDEVTHWPDSSKREDRVNDVYDAVMTGTGKLPGTVVVQIMNAGIKESWQDKYVYRHAKESKLWRVWDNDGKEGTIASWMSPAIIADLSKSIPAIEADRVFRNVWVNMAVASEFLNSLDVALIVRPDIRPHLLPLGGFFYIISVDYGPYKDRTCVTVKHRDAAGNIVVDRIKIWQGDKSKGLAGEVKIAEIEAYVEKMFALYKPKAVTSDPYQMVNSCQKWERLGWNVVRIEPRGGAAAKSMATLLRTLVAEHRLWVPPEVNQSEVVADDFVTELKNLVTKYNRLGYRFENTKDCHDDRAVCIATGAAEALKYPPVAHFEPLLKVEPPVINNHTTNPLVTSWKR